VFRLITGIWDGVCSNTINIFFWIIIVIYTWKEQTKSHRLTVYLCFYPENSKSSNTNYSHSVENRSVDILCLPGGGSSFSAMTRSHSTNRGLIGRPQWDPAPGVCPKQIAHLSVKMFVRNPKSHKPGPWEYTTEGEARSLELLGVIPQTEARLDDLNETQLLVCVPNRLQNCWNIRQNRWSLHYL
jgi:hypothetical protein